MSLAGFLNLSATCSSPHRPAVFRQVTLVGFTLQGVHPLSPDPGNSSLPSLPSCRSPSVCASPVLGEGNRRRIDHDLGRGDRCLSRLQGLRPRENRSALSTRFRVTTADLSPLGFPPPHGFVPPQVRSGSPLRTVTASRPPTPSPELAAAAFHGFTLTGADPLSPENPPIPRFHASDHPTCSSDIPARAHRTFGPFASTNGAPCEALVRLFALSIPLY